MGATAIRAVNDPKHVFYSFSAQGEIDPVVVSGGAGSWFWDQEGRRYLDFASQQGNLTVGHQHPHVIASLKAQLDRLCTIAPYHASEIRGEAARLIAARAPAKMTKVLFTTGGADANEHALRLARLHTKRQKVLAAYRSYHGGTHEAITVSGESWRWGAEPGIPGVVHFFGPDPYRSEFNAASAVEESERALAHVASVLRYEGPETVAAIVIESVVGGPGVLVPPDGYLAGLRRLCDEHGIMLICDEVLSGFGRCGEWFAVDRWGVRADLITFAKGVSAGYVPLGGVVLCDEVAATFARRAYPGGLTSSGHPLACAAAVAVIEVLEQDGLIDRARQLGLRRLGPGLAALAARHPSVGVVRGIGCFWAIELVRSRASREPMVPYGVPPDRQNGVAAFRRACRDRGLWPQVIHNNVLLMPPLNVSDDDLDLGLSILDEGLDAADAYVTD